MYQIAYGTNSPTQSASAIQRAVEISIAQLLPVLWMQAAVLARELVTGLTEPLPEEFRGRHPRTDPLELFDSHAVEATLAAGFLDGPDHHSPDERRNPLHA